MKNLTPLPWHETAQQVLASRPILLLVGPPGSGKSTLASELAKNATGREPVVLQNHPENRQSTLLGLYTVQDGRTQFVDGYLTRAVRENRWFVLEDVNQSPQLAASHLLPIREGQPLTLPNGEALPIPKDFRVVLTANRFDFGCARDTTVLQALVSGSAVLTIEGMSVTQIEQLLRRRHPNADEDDVNWVLSTFQELGIMRSSNEKEMSLGYRTAAEALDYLVAGMPRDQVTQIAFVNKFLLDKDLYEAAQLEASTLT